MNKPIGYVPVFAPTGLTTAAIMSCIQCGVILDGMGGPGRALCPGCTKSLIDGEQQAPDYSREAFEEKAFADYFIRGIRRNPSVPKPRIAGCLDFVPAEDVQDKAAFCERDGESYKREDVSAMWHGWKLLVKSLGWRPASEPPQQQGRQS